MRVHLTASFRKDLDAIWDFLARSSVEAADRVTAELIDRALEIASMPEGAAFVPQLRHLETRRVLVRRWAILYGVMGDEVVVMRVVHGGRSLERLRFEE